MSTIGCLLLWGYGGLLLFTWHGASHLGDRFVLVRIGASIASDLVWLPFGMIVWGAFVFLLLKRIVRPAIAWTAVAAVIVAILIDHHAAFRWMFLPLTADAVVLVIGAVRRRVPPAVVFPLMAVTVIVAGYYRGQLLPAPGLSDNGGVTLKVMSYNIFGRAGTLNRYYQIDTIRRENPDIVCIMEYYPRTDFLLFREQLGDRYPYMISNRSERSWNSGELVMSRFPVSSRRIVAIPGRRGDMDFMFTEIEVNGRTINLVSFHFITVGHDIIDQVFSSRSLAERIDSAARAERENDRIKHSQARELVEFTVKLEDPVILCGDMNDTPNSRTYRLFSGRYTNTFKSAGWGLGDTFGELSLARRLSPLVARDVIRIDQIFVDEHFRVLSARVIGDAEGSDHKPVVAEVSLRDVPPAD